jgi:hypothetical protein
MAWLAVDGDDFSEWIYEVAPCRGELFNHWVTDANEYAIELPKGSIKRLIGRELTWEDEPVEFLSDGDYNEQL